MSFPVGFGFNFRIIVGSGSTFKAFLGSARVRVPLSNKIWVRVGSVQHIYGSLRVRVRIFGPVKTSSLYAWWDSSPKNVKFSNLINPNLYDYFCLMCSTKEDLAVFVHTMEVRGPKQHWTTLTFIVWAKKTHLETCMKSYRFGTAWVNDYRILISG